MAAVQISKEVVPRVHVVAVAPEVVGVAVVAEAAVVVALSPSIRCSAASRKDTSRDLAIRVARLWLNLLLQKILTRSRR